MHFNSLPSDCFARVTSSIDYLRLICDDVDPSEVDYAVGVAEVYWGAKLAESDGKPRKVGRWFGHYRPSDCGSYSVHYNSESDLAVMVTISGKFLSALQPAEVRDLMCAFYDRGYHASRLDIAVDDYDWSVNPDLIRDAVLAGQFARYKFGQVLSTTDGGFTYCLGRRSGERFVRIYNKFVESKGAYDCIRYESEFKARVSAGIFVELCAPASRGMSDQEWLCLASGFCLGAIDFVDRAAATKQARKNERLGWWQAFLDRCAGVIRYRVAKIKSTIIATKQWIERSVATSVATLREALGESEFNGWWYKTVSKAAGRISDIQWSRIQTYQFRRSPDYYRSVDV